MQMGLNYYTCQYDDTKKKLLSKPKSLSLIHKVLITESLLYFQQQDSDDYDGYEP
jgi:hypothetical protein